MTLEDIVEKLFADNPDLNEEEAVRQLKEVKDPQTNKSMWKAGTIRNRVNTYLRTNRKASHAYVDESNKPPVETKGSGSNLEIEEKEIEQHKPKDPFAIKSEPTAEEKEYQTKNMKPTIDTEQFKQGIMTDVSKKVFEQVSAETKSFRDETVSIISDLKSSMVDVITDMKEEMITIQKQSLSTYEPVVKYNDIKLKESTIDTIRKNTEEKELKEESEYIDKLIDSEKEYASIFQVYHKLIDLAKEAKNGVQLRLFYENDKLSYTKKPVGRFGISPKSLIIGVSIGIAIGVCIVLIYTALTGVPSPIPAPIP